MDAAKTLFLSYVLLIIFRSTFCTSLDTISINQTLMDGSLLISKANNFALGFFSPGSSTHRYLGIWYHKVSVQTVVWVANRNNPINSTAGFLSINQHGNLVLNEGHDRKVQVWSANVSGQSTDTCMARLLDSGNLVLLHDARITWQSFDYPTNTFLQGMKLGLDRNSGLNRLITSWRSLDDPGTGNYSLKLNPSGSPQFFLYKNTNSHYFRCGPWPWKTKLYLYNFSFIFNEDEIYFRYRVNDASVIQRVFLDHTGKLKQLTWREKDSQWKEFRSSPDSMCDFYGMCGAYSKCNPNNVDFECTCLPGYEPKSPRDWLLRDGSGGCVRKQHEPSGICKQGEGFVKEERVMFPDTSAAVWLSFSMSRMECEQQCLRNCSCSAYASIDIAGKGRGCLVWYGELTDTKDIISDGYDLYVRVDAIELAEHPEDFKGILEMKGILAILIVPITSTWIVVSIFIYLWLRRRKQKAINKWSKSSLDPINVSNDNENRSIANELRGNASHQNLVFFSLHTIFAATNNFSPNNKLGHGGFGTVYKGQLPNGQEVAVKRLSANSGQGVQEFKNEVFLIAKLQHRNLVKLLGCCIQRGEKILVYEHLPNKSLNLFLFDQTRRLSLVWSKRVDIIIGIARGMLYLHQDSRLRIIHRDLKTSNILLDAEMNPKISDFGMARIFNGDQSQDNTKRIVGTYGYMSPEYAIFGKFSVKSDVFSFGVILLEIISGTKNNNFYKDDPSLTLIGRVWELWREGMAIEIVDSQLNESYPSQEALRCIQIGLLCVQEDANDRPTMLEVVLMLKSETPLPSPKQPAFIFWKSHNNPTLSAAGVAQSSVNEVTMTDAVAR